MADLDEEREKVKTTTNLWIGISLMLMVCVFIFRKNITDWKACLGVLVDFMVVTFIIKTIFVALYNAYEDWIWKDK